jgi:hypothetical protein
MWKLSALTITLVAMMALPTGAGAWNSDRAVGGRPLDSDQYLGFATGRRAARLETLWIFEADFEDEIGDNAGWTSHDMSGTLAQVNYWHHDTIRLTEPYLGDSTWWCGTNTPCWRQPRGYGNDWYQVLERSLTEVGSTSPGDVIELEFDQRYAMERNYDYGYVEVSDDDGVTWNTVASYSNTGFQGAGVPHDWDHPIDGHVTLDLSAYAGGAVRLRFRFESDSMYSSEDAGDSPQHSVLDGAWQLDNIAVEVNDSPVFYDDAESGNMGWVHDDREASGQTAVVFWRGRYGIDFVTGRDFTCVDRPFGSWMYAAVDPFTHKMVDGQRSWLMSPPIDVSGVSTVTGFIDIWLDTPMGTSDHLDFYAAGSDFTECVTDPGEFADITGGAVFISDPGGEWVGAKEMAIYNPLEHLGEYVAYDWLGFVFQAMNGAPAEIPHMAGVFVNRLSVGVPVGDPGMRVVGQLGFYDLFQDDLAQALTDSGYVEIVDRDGVASAFVVASGDGGATWEAYSMRKYVSDVYENYWLAPPPVNQMLPGAEIRYYYEATDSLGSTSSLPSNAPDESYEFSILPIEATVSNPGLLIVDDQGLAAGALYGAPDSDRLAAGEDRSWRHPKEYYYREPLEILGYECDTYDVPGPTGGYTGPDTVGMKYYHTIIWFTGEHDFWTLFPDDQLNLREWLSQAAEGKERNLLLAGENIGYDLIETGEQVGGFYNTWLASEYIANSVGVCTVDSIPGVIDDAGGFDFFTHDDCLCILAGGCPDPLEAFDVVDARAGVVGNEVVVNYQREDLSTAPAGVAYTHPTMGYQTVNLGFGFESVMHGTNPDNPGNYTPEGYYHTGIADRVDLMGNIMEYFGLSPGGTGTGVAEGGIENTLSQARPNPFNPVTKIAYSVREGGPVAIEIYSVAGRVVRRILDAELETGASSSVVWDGTNDAGERCASGVYFYRIVAPGFTASRRMVLLK